MIACTVTKNIPFVMGDVLFSLEGAGKNDMIVPTSSRFINEQLPDEM
jgi:hypothetical protein